MALQCGTCGGQVKDTTAKFCSHCGARMDGKSKSAATQGGAAALIAPVGEAGKASALPVIYCPAHPRRKVDGFCQQCEQLVCLGCVTQKPRLHESCQEPLGLEDLLAMNDPFEGRRKQLLAGQKAREKLLKDMKTRKTDIGTKSRDEVSKLCDMEADALKLLDEKLQAEVAKLTSDCEHQKSLVKKTTKTMISRITVTEKKIVVDIQTTIDAIAAELQHMKAADKKLASTFSANTLVEQVAGSKEARQVLSKTPAAPAPAPLPSATASDEAQLRRLADLTVEVTTKKLQASANKGPPQHVSTKATKPTEATKSDVALTGPDAVFAVGSRVVAAPGFAGRLLYGGPGTVTAVGNGTAEVLWDRSGRHYTCFIGYNGQYQLQLVKPS